ncbi:MAG TPA: four-helix bundle copper-binding protein [Bacteroidota bacterium]|nr:four-helix bundle copper-binding protein [Bacteroidota bacterium]
MAHQKDSHGHSSAGSAHEHVMTMDHVSKDMQRCITNCTDCSTICRDTITHCLDLGGEHAHGDHIWLLMDCAEICQTSAHIMMHNSPGHHATCAACAEICEQCAEDCARYGDDRMMQACADMCRRCAESCSKMAHA